MNTVFMFSGQGAQYPSMGRELYEHNSAARAVFDMAESIRPGTVEQCFSGSDEILQMTENTQPCVYCVDLAAAEALREAMIVPDMLAGFSLGEVAALAFSGAVTYEDGFKLVCKRAKFMQEASEMVDAAMVAVLKLSDDMVIDLCGEFSKVYPVNFNCPGQIVVAGESSELAAFVNRVKDAGGRSIKLKTSGGFHSPFMDEASIAFAQELEKADILSPKTILYSNTTGRPYDGNTKELLAKQICSPVRWESSIRHMLENHVDTFIEVGPGKTLCGLVQKIADNVEILNVEDIKSLEETLKALRR